MNRAVGFILVAAMAASWSCGSDDSGAGSAGAETNCTDKVDNDGDSLTDCADPDCAKLFWCAATGGTAGDAGGGTGGSGAGGTGGSSGSSGDAGVNLLCDCDDNLSCTTDLCAADDSCRNITLPDSCVIDGKCYSAGQHNGSKCEICDPKVSQTSWTGIANGCQTTSYCYAKGEKDTNGCSVCDPAKSGTSLVPAKNDCNIGGKCYEAGEKDAAGCNVCDPTQTPTAWTQVLFDCKIGGVCYKNGQQHPSSSCSNVVCDSATSASSWTVQGDECLVGSVCASPGDQSPSRCTACIPATSKTTLSTADYDCKIGTTCFKNGDPHPSSTCSSTVCDGTATASAWTVKGNECLIGSSCVPAGDTSSDGCTACDPAQSTTAYSPANYDCKIANKCYKNQDKHPSSTCTSVVCNGAVSATEWTVTGSECLIGTSCRKTGDQNSGGCEECNPAKNTLDWSPVGNNCRISGACYPAGAKHPDAACSFVECDGASNPTDWSVKGTGCYIGGKCYASGAASPLGCEQCDPVSSKVNWTPIGQCSKVVIAALNEAHDGNLGGIAGANALCATQAQAAGKTGTWKAFLSSSTQNVKDLITGTAAAYPVVNLNGGVMFPSWAGIFVSGTWPSSTGYLVTFDGKVVNEGQTVPDWSDAHGWTGSTVAGIATTSTCADWTSTTGSGTTGEWDFYHLVQSASKTCATTVAVACVQIP